MADDLEDPNKVLQKFKIARADEAPKEVLNALNNKEFTHGVADNPLLRIHFQDIDFTLDFAGSFDKEKIISILLQDEDF